MKGKLALFALAVTTTVLRVEPDDLTGADAASFKSHLGQVVILQGRLEQGMRGLCLFDATPTNVVFYIMPEIPTNASFVYPQTWTRLTHHPVQITGELKFASFNHSNAGPLDQAPPDYYYMELQKTKIERVEPK